MDSDGKMVIGILLAIKHHTGTAAQKSVRTFASRYTTGNAPASRMRSNNSASPYDRMLTFADMSNPGKCFVMIFPTSRDSDRLLSYLKITGMIGDYFAVVEPDGIQKSLTDQDLPIVESKNKLVPLDRPADETSVPFQIPLRNPLRIPL